ncbi:TRAP transporter large permease [Paracoccus litorisediminis]|uniref:TRAP transporter large permease protein n=1 Tax=Paracoccus litorisediminis TaxID=2006130 RepID=A0A844HSD9_9RHOB|nr:TRAP transporter large permease [Paracoccus litorisediminis]MTH61354.1 TRAP transporter large permease subunit [Paracoccus litorisediminis]
MLTLFVFSALLGLIAFTRVPLGFAMMLVGTGGIAAIHPKGIGAALAIAEQQVVKNATNYQFSALPLFILMGVFIVKASLAEELFEAARRWFGRFRGGLGMATIVACGGFSAMCASSSAAAATMAKIAIPEMDRAGYDPGFSAGSIAAGGTMGVLIPPSGALIIYALLTLQNVSELFVAGILPGLAQVVIYVGVMAVIAMLRPEWAPRDRQFSKREKWSALGKIWGVAVLFSLIMAGLVKGWFTATEAGGIGAGGAFVLLVLRRKLTWAVLVDSLLEAARISTMIFIVAAGALVLNQFINLSGVSGQAIRYIQSLDLSPAMIVACLLVFYLVLGCLMDGFAMIFLTVPIVAPIIEGLGYDLVWWGIVTVIVVEISLITPPVGLNVFILKAMLPKLPVMRIFRGIVPYVAADFLRLALILIFPAMALWLPGML